MTCKEKLRTDHPDWDEYTIGLTVGSSCPGEFGYPEDPAYDCSGKDACIKCWDREIPETVKKEEENKMIYAHIPGDVGVEDKDIPNTPKSCIKDSGDRTQFESGAVRDMREGKGRFDLAPLDVMANLINGRGFPEKEEGMVIHNIKTFLEKNDTYYLYLALEHFTDRCYERSLPTMLLEVAKHFEEGAKKYGPDNWRKGIPVYCYIDSAIRHYLKWLRGDNDEPHDRAFVWNLMCCIWEVDYGEEWRKSKEAD